MGRIKLAIPGHLAIKSGIWIPIPIPDAAEGCTGVD